MIHRTVQMVIFFFFQAEDGIRDLIVTGVQTCALPIFLLRPSETAESDSLLRAARGAGESPQEVLLRASTTEGRSEEHTSELQSRSDLVCRLLLEKKKKKEKNSIHQHECP